MIFERLDVFNCFKEFVEVHRSRLASNNNKEQLIRTYSDCFISSSSDDNSDRALVHALANHVAHGDKFV